MADTFRLTRDYPLLGLKAGDLCRYGVRPGELEVYRTIGIGEPLIADLMAGRPLSRPSRDRATPRHQPQPAAA